MKYALLAILLYAAALMSCTDESTVISSPFYKR